MSDSTNTADVTSQDRSPRIRVWRAVALVMTVAGIAVVLSQVFLWNPFGPTMLTNQFLYVVLALFLSQVFIYYRWRTPARSAEELAAEELPDHVDSDHTDRESTFAVPWPDALLFATTASLCPVSYTHLTLPTNREV